MTREYGVRYRGPDGYDWTGWCRSEATACRVAKNVNDYGAISAEVVSREVGDWVPVTESDDENGSEIHARLA